MNRYPLPKLVALSLPCLACLAQDPSLLVKSHRFEQRQAAAPVEATDRPFRISYFGEGLAALGSTAALVLPSAARRDCVAQGNDLTFTDSAATGAELDRTYGTGTYTVSLDAFGSTLGGAAVLGTAAYPDAPRILDLAAVQSIDADSDLVLRASPLIAPGPEDFLRLVIRSGTDIPVYSEEFFGSDPVEFTVAARTLAASTDYSVELSSVRITGHAPETGLAFAVGFSSVTTATIHTAAGGGNPADQTPPVLTASIPVDGALMTNRLSPFAVRFSEPMDPGRRPLTFTATKAGTPLTLDTAKLTLLWDGQSTSLVALYDQAGGGWPVDAVVTWTLKGGIDGFRDAAGNPLATSSGTFLTSVGADGKVCPGATAMEDAGFGVTKLVNYLQTGTGTPLNDPTNGAVIQAFAEVPGAPPGYAALEFPADPAPKPHQLKFFTQFAGVQLLTQVFPNRGELDAAYPAGTYDFEFRDKASPTTVVVHTVLDLGATGYPPVPRFSGFDAAQRIDPAKDFALGWETFAGAGTADSLSITITDENGDTVLSLPDACAGRLLAVTSTSVVVPKYLLKPGKTYVATLGFFRITDQGKVMPGTTSRGITALGRSTRMTLGTVGTAVSAPVLRGIALRPDGQLALTVESAVGRVFFLDRAATLPGPFAPYTNTTPASPTFDLVLPASDPGFFRGRVE